LRGIQPKTASEVRFRRKSGGAFDALISRSEMRGTDGLLLGCVTSVLDLTDRKRAVAERGA
jgi:PAS domain S-box-containing protein